MLLSLSSNLKSNQQALSRPLRSCMKVKAKGWAHLTFGSTNNPPLWPRKGLLLEVQWTLILLYKRCWRAPSATMTQHASSCSCQSHRQVPNPSLCACIQLWWAIYGMLAETLRAQHQINPITDDDNKKLGEGTGQCKTDREAEPP